MAVTPTSTDRRLLPAFGPWRDPETRRRAATVTLGFALWASLVQLLWILLGISAVGELAPPLADRWLEHYDPLAGVADGLWYVAVTIAGVAFIAWQRQLIRNTAFLGCERPDPSPAVATLCWFVPVANLVVPPLSLVQVERWSRPSGHHHSAAFLIVAWWTSWLAAAVPAVAAAVLHALGQEPTLWIAGQAAAAAAIVMRLAAGILALRLVAVLTRRQQLVATFRGTSDHPSLTTDH